MRPLTRTAFIAFLVGLTAEAVAWAEGPGAAGMRRAYFRAESPAARKRVAPFVTRELPGGILIAALPATSLDALTSAPDLTLLGFEALFHPAPIAAEEVGSAGTGSRIAGEVRTCFIPRFIGSPIGWGIKALYEDPALLQPSGGAGVKVAVIDGGVSPHLDVVRRLARCLDLTPPGGTPACADSIFHGTQVASIIAADGGFDGLGMWGMAPEATIYSYRVCEPNAECWGSYIAAGIYAAIDDGVNIINLSLTGSANDEAVRAAIDDAVAHNILVVAAAGNSPPYSYVGYPAAYPEVLSVGAIVESRAPWSYSEAGLNDGDYIREHQELDVAAPGASVLAALKTGCYVLGSGTSLAAPHVAGLAAKLWNGDAAATRARLLGAARAHDLYVAGDDTLTGSGLPTITPFVRIDVTAGPGGMVSPSGLVYVAVGGTRTFTISPTGCSRIEDVVVDGVSQGPITSYTFDPLTSDHTIRATFSGAMYTLVANAGPGGTITPGGTLSLACNSTTTCTIKPSSNCYLIQDVLVDGVSQGPISSYTFASVVADHTIQATFVVVAYAVQASGDALGSISPSGAIAVPCAGNVTFTLTPFGCNRPGSLLVDGHRRGMTATYTFTNVRADHSIAATFASGPGTFSIYSAADPGGTISPQGKSTVACQGGQTYTIVPDDCNRIENVLVDGVPQGAISQFTFATVSVEHTIHASFSPRGPVAIQASAGPGGTILPSGTASVSCGGSQSFTVAPADSCHEIRDVKVDGVSRGPVSSFTFSGATSDHGIEATFSRLGAGTIGAGTGSIGKVRPGNPSRVACGGVEGNASASPGAPRPSGEAAAASALAGAGPAEPVLGRPTPNPTVGRLTFRYGIPAASAVRLSIMDLKGREVAVLAEGARPAGWLWAAWDGRTPDGQAAGGVYFIRLQAGGRNVVQRFALLR